MIIGISGKKQSGKDTIAKIIQWLVYSSYKPQKHHTQEEWLKTGDVWGLSSWDRKQFADKLKNIVCLLIGCTREQLENNTFKETPLGSEWSRILCDEEQQKKYYPIKCTKCTWMGCSCECNGGVPIADTGDFSNPLCPVCWANVEDSNNEVKMTPRKLLQLLGTDCGRKIIHPNIWVNALMSEYKPTVNREFNMASSESDMPDWIITDVRFPNELKSIEDRGGVVIRVNRHDLIYTTEDRHESETALDNHEFSCFTISNDGTIEDLISKVRLILETIKIL